jgi:hypothetical protein
MSTLTFDGATRSIVRSTGSIAGDRAISVGKSATTTLRIRALAGVREPGGIACSG